MLYQQSVDMEGILINLPLQYMEVWKNRNVFFLSQNNFQFFFIFV